MLHMTIEELVIQVSPCNLKRRSFEVLEFLSQDFKLVWQIVPMLS